MGGQQLILADTHAWLWWVNEDQRLGRTARTTLQRESVIGVAAVSCWEVALLVARGRLTLNRDLSRWFEDALLPGMTALIPLTPAIALRAVQLRPALRDPADCMIAATAIDLNVPLATADARLHALPGLHTIW
jgi:PIN domain nuclease of toxin-antitoxin system